MQNHPYAPDFRPETWTDEERRVLAPFVTTLDGHVAVLRNLPPELVGALCSRASRAPGSLVRILYEEYFKPILEGEDRSLAEELEALIAFFGGHAPERIAKRGREFYAKWLAQYGDDSIAQMTGTHVVFPMLSQIGIKILEDQRIALEPIEKSTRYVQFGDKVDGKYLYYTPRPDLQELGLLAEYAETMDHLFETYRDLQAPLMAWLAGIAPDEKKGVIEKKAFDTLRGLLPMATLGQVAFRGNAQALEYALNRMLDHRIGEARWAAEMMQAELNKEMPSLFMRTGGEKSVEYRKYLRERPLRIREFIAQRSGKGPRDEWGLRETCSKPVVELVRWDDDAEEEILTGILFPEMHRSWKELRRLVDALSAEERDELLGLYLQGRTERWQKVGRAFENSFARFEIVMNIGAYRDLHRHRMMTQQRELFSCHHGYDLPEEVQASGLSDRFEEALRRAARLFTKLEAADPELAQYVVPLAYRIRFEQYENFRQLFWEMELRTISQGHPDYRVIEQEKFRLLAARFPRIAAHMRVDVNDYAFARRGTEEAIAKKEALLKQKLKELGT